MLDQFVQTLTTECLEVLFHVSLRGLAPVTDCHGHEFVVVTTGAGLEQVSASLIDRSNQESDAEGSLAGVASLDLRLFADLDDKTLAGVVAAVSVLVVEALVSHELGEEASICGHTRDNDAHVVIDLEDFLLVACQIMRRFLEADKDLAYFG